MFIFKNKYKNQIGKVKFNDNDLIEIVFEVGVPSTEIELSFIDAIKYKNKGKFIRGKHKIKVFGYSLVNFFEKYSSSEEIKNIKLIRNIGRHPDDIEEKLENERNSRYKTNFLIFMAIISLVIHLLKYFIIG